MKLTIVLLFISVSVLAVAHFLALEFYLYWQYAYFDVPLHILGGAIAALALFALRDLGMAVPVFLLRFPMVLLFVFVVGMSWEYFEVAAGLYRAENYAFDTALDIVMDLVGGAIGYFVGSRITTL